MSKWRTIDSAPKLSSCNPLDAPAPAVRGLAKLAVVAITVTTTLALVAIAATTMLALVWALEWMGWM